MILDIDNSSDTSIDSALEMYHHGIKGQHWGVRRYQNSDGSLTPEGREHYGIGQKIKGAADAIRKKIKPTKEELDESLAKAERKRDIRAEKQQIKDTNKEFKRKRIKNMTNEEIQDEIERLALERDLKDMRESAKMSKGKEAFRNAIQNAKNKAVANAIESITGAAVDKIATAIAANQEYKLAQEEAKLQRRVIGKDGEKAAEAYDTLDAYADLMNKRAGKFDKGPSQAERILKDQEADIKARALNGDPDAKKQWKEYRDLTENKNDNKNGKSQAQRDFEDLEAQRKTEILQGNKKAKKQMQDLQEATAKPTKGNNNSQSDSKKVKQAKKAQQQAEEKAKKAEQARQQAEQQAKDAEQKRSAAEKMAQQYAQQAADSAKASEQAKQAVREWAKHKYSKKVTNSDGSVSYIYPDDQYQQWMQERLNK